MKQEEKAKRYDEALEELRGLLECVHEEKREILEEDITSIFPELKESSDERIRQELIAIYSVGAKANMKTGDIPDKDIVAWLEKQGENHDDKYNITGIKSKHAEGKLGEMIKEIKSADKAEPKFKVKYAGHDYNVLEIKDIAGITFYGIEDEPNHIDYVQAENCERVDGYSIKESGSPFPTKPAKFSEQNSAWSEEDEYCRHQLIVFCENCMVSDSGAKRCAHWLKSLKNRVQPQLKQEWSEEDEGILDEIIDFLENGTVKLQHDLSLYASWLKSLKDRYAWKPSWEQLDALEYHLKHTNENSRLYKETKELYDQLKKL